MQLLIQIAVKLEHDYTGFWVALMNYAAFLAVLVTLSFVMPLVLRVVLWLQPDLIILSSILVSVASAIWLIRKRQSVNQHVSESSQEFSSLLPPAQEEDYHASL